MSSVFVNSSGKEFADGIVFDDSNKVVSVKSNEYPTLSTIVPGMFLRSLNGVPVVKAREQQSQLKSVKGEILAVFTAVTKDEFDLSSEEDADNAFNPASALAPMAAEYKSSVARGSALVIGNVAAKVTANKCIVIMIEGANPALPIALAAERAGVDVMYIDTIGRMKTRQSIEEAGDVFRRSLEKGLWIYVEQATKSITLLQKLAETMAEADARKALNVRSRVFLMCEPHPHFPEYPMKNCVTLRCRLLGDSAAAVDVKEDLLESKRRRNLLSGSDDVATSAKPEVAKAKKKVRISNEVNVVQLEKNAFMEMSASAHLPAKDNPSGDGLTRKAKYTFGSNEKFISLCKVRDNRFAVGTNSGYVVLLDSDALPLIQFRPHKACVWDVSFASQFDFATACEDGTSTYFQLLSSWTGAHCQLGCVLSERRVCRHIYGL
ncbi:hypothetical protein STCU_09495 [Strigomonas culicis]|uniref:Uncharacterized protein n=1 Tax=Strigomonas culicis TaxID=28005 RepID=S9UXR6_9TRYP|nr:hypothetical protein STCU_09495 [Strigomonas culicis]|eukprot:EPY19366.1 hypothetical protein STCU_09495 [Strigomonas culicis]